MMKITNEISDNLKKTSGSFNDNSRLVNFLYTLMINHVPVGFVQKLLEEACVPVHVFYTNGFVAQYAKFVEEKLLENKTTNSKKWTWKYRPNLGITELVNEDTSTSNILQCIIQHYSEDGIFIDKAYILNDKLILVSENQDSALTIKKEFTNWLISAGVIRENDLIDNIPVKEWLNNLS